MKTRTKIILWSLPLLLIILTYLYMVVVSNGLNVPWKLVGKPSENISEIIGYNPGVGKFYVRSVSGEMYSFRYYHYNDPVPPPSDWSKDNSYKKELDPIHENGYEPLKFPSPPLFVKVKQIYQIEFHGVENISVTKIALSEDGNLWSWRGAGSGLEGVLYVLILATEVLAYAFALFIYFAILLTKKVTRKFNRSNSACGLLLDLPHARIAAEAFGMETTEYIRQLPLERVVEIHTSGPGRRQDGSLIDQHCVMQAEDYSLLEWALAHTPVKLVTLEYIKDRDGLREQLIDLSHIIKPEGIYSGPGS